MTIEKDGHDGIRIESGRFRDLRGVLTGNPARRDA